MNLPLPFKFLAACFAACFLTVAVIAADASPAGNWRWTQQGRQGGQGLDRTMTLEFKDGKLTGMVKGVAMGQFEIPDTAISEGSFKEGNIAFEVTMEFNGNKFTIKYAGKFSGDKITGSSESPGRDGQVTKRDWVVERTK